MTHIAQLEAQFGPLSDREQKLVAAAQGSSFQDRVLPWMWATFGQEISSDRQERNHRFLEEALELAQAGGCSREEVMVLLDYVYTRPVGELSQEVGGVMITLAALCLAWKVDMHQAANVELARVWTISDKIRAKQATKPHGTPLPQAVLPKPCYRVHVERMVESCGTSYVICIDRPDRPRDAKPWDEGRISPDRFENVEHANGEAQEWAEFLDAEFTPYTE